MTDLTEILKQNNNVMNDVANNLIDLVKRFNGSETKINLLKAQLTSNAGVVGLPNQALREAAIEEKLQTDPLYVDDYRQYLELKTYVKVAWIQWDLIKEQNSNTRTILNASTYGGNN